MKKTSILLSIAAGFLFASCDMDLAPIGSLDDENAIESPSDLLKDRNGIYNNIRSVCTGSFIYLSDLQMDQFMGLIINGNRNGIIAHGNILSNNSDIESIWASYYSCIADANYLLGRAEILLEKGGWTQEEVLDINRYIGETKFARAYYYYQLIDRFSASYTSANANQEASGVPLVTVFNPTGDIASYPGRSTQAEVYALIDQDLADAYEALKAYEAVDNSQLQPMAVYVNTNVITAFQARLALLRQDWPTAIAKANEIINCGVYSLATTANYAQMWTDDYSDELIFRPISTNNELGISSIGGAYISATLTQADYIPTAEVYSSYLSTDVRRSAFFKARSLDANGTSYQCYCFNKFPGNTALYTSNVNNLLNMGKPFRLSEMYLILAEASYENGDEPTANSALNTLRSNRINRYAETTYTGLDLRDQIRTERAKELIGEGFRLSDLRRWKLGFTRDGSYPLNPVVTAIFNVVDMQVTYTSDDYRYVWPIPSTEIENNPQLKGQQNPGY
ncbi:MAG: RagB/SusD family nutrient uptake outer membrane protein [Muribaculaceae bacterium]|nr:RagB/SusD family nutrient uptake outer membrane protein [Muribaculaceae bacterium]